MSEATRDLGNPGHRAADSRWRIAAWGLAGFILLLPLAAMPFTNEVNWTGRDFGLAALFLFAPLTVYEVVARNVRNTFYRGGVGIALLASLLLLWVSAAVGITDGPGDLLHISSLGVAGLGALLARGRAPGMAWAMYATAIALCVSAITVLAAGLFAASTPARATLILTGFFAALFVAAGLLFRRAARS